MYSTKRKQIGALGSDFNFATSFLELGDASRWDTDPDVISSSVISRYFDGHVQRNTTALRHTT